MTAPFKARLSARSGNGEPPYDYLVRTESMAARRAISKATDEPYPNGLHVLAVQVGADTEVVRAALAFYAESAIDDAEFLALVAQGVGLTPKAYAAKVRDLRDAFGGA